MFKSLVNATKDVSSSALEQSRKAMDSGKKKLAEFDEKNTCMSCGKILSTTLSMVQLKALHACCSCGDMCCSDCLISCPAEIPDEMWAHPSLSKVEYKKKPKFCQKKCKEKLYKRWLSDFCDENREEFTKALHLYLSEGPDNYPAIEKPKHLADGNLRKTMRMMVLVEHAAEVVGYDRYLAAIKAIAKSGGLMGILLQNDYVSKIYPLMDLLKDFGITGPNGLLRLFYYGSHHELLRKLDFESVLDGHRTGDVGVIAEQCPQDVLKYVGRYAGPACWMYLCKLPEPHDEDNWSKWYLSRLVYNNGWSLLACSPSATVHYEIKSPAFSLVARSNSSTGRPEALLTIRGTQSVVDWSINVDDEMFPFTYRGGIYGENEVKGCVHKAMMVGALKILDSFAMRECIHQLVKDGFDVKIVGHSLGAATACLIAAELRNGFYEGKYSDIKSQREKMKKYDEEDSNDGYRRVIPLITAIGFGTPPCISESIANAMLADKLMVSVVHCDDIVPRLSRYNIQNLAIEVNKFSASAATYQKEDQKCLEAYARSYGIAGDMSKTEEVKDISPQPDADEAIAVESTSEINELEEPFVVPGEIVHLTFCNASYQATLCDYRLPALRTIIPLTSIVKNHEMTAHVEALRSLKLKQSGISVQQGPTWQRIRNPDSKEWARCHICECDPLWPYITKSEPTRGSCGKICCSVCAPAGDHISADGIGKFHKLPDHRLSLPFIGLTGKQRVCTVCFLHSYDKIG